MERIFKNTENSTINKPYQFVLNLSQGLGLKISNKHVALQNLSIYYTWKNIRKQCENNKLKIIAPKWHDEFELPDDSYGVSDIQDYMNISLKNMRHGQQLPLLMFTSIELIID